MRSSQATCHVRVWTGLPEDGLLHLIVRLDAILSLRRLRAASRFLGWLYGFTCASANTVIRQNLSLMQRGTISRQDATGVLKNFMTTAADYVAFASADKRKCAARSSRPARHSGYRELRPF
ncbi:hypothetical protein BH09VER1_BH09VER1_29370 [soil metagenome]